MRKCGSTRDKACQTILDILKSCDIIGGQTAKQRISIISKIIKTGYNDRIYMIGET